MAVVTNPDRPAGRGYELKAPPVKVVAQDHGLHILQPAKASDPSFRDELQSLAPDVCPVVAYGKILPADLLEIPPHGFVNLHFSLLPEYRGAAPVQRAVMDGKTVSGVTIMLLTEGMDEGPVLATMETSIGERETAGELGARLAVEGAPLLVATLERLETGGVTPLPQDDAAATYAPKISSSEAEIDWGKHARAVDALVRGLNPAPGAWTTHRGARVKVHVVTPVEGEGDPGEVLDPSGPTVATGAGAVRLDSVQPAGKRAMPGGDFARGARLRKGDRFGSEEVEEPSA